MKAGKHTCGFGGDWVESVVKVAYKERKGDWEWRRRADIGGENCERAAPLKRSRYGM
jgi:hypothetical protein